MLVERAVGGEREAFSILLREHDALMRSVAWRIVGRYNLVDDALQDAYVKAYCNIQSFRADGPFAAWLRRIVVNTCIDHVRRQQRLLEDPTSAEEVETIVSGSVERPPAAERLHEALHNLPDDQRITLVLVEWEGYSYDQVATMTHTSTGNVGSRLSRARSHLRGVLEEG